MSQSFADRFLQAARDKGAPVCVGLDPVFDRLPESLRRGVNPNDAAAVCAVISKWCIDLLEVVAPHVPCVKPQIACFERYLGPGVETFYKVVDAARKMNLVVIGDAKRGDIGTSSAHYAAGNLEDTGFDDLGALQGPDALTVNGYLGDDALGPFADVAREKHKGLFVLVRTSNPGGDALQTLELADGRTICEAMADLVINLGEQSAAKSGSGYSDIGAVVGATKPKDAATLRKRMPRQLFLVPGFGAQGGGAEDARPCFNDDKQGAIITASRSVIYAHQSDPGTDWKTSVKEAAIDLNCQIASILE